MVNEEEGIINDVDLPKIFLTRMLDSKYPYRIKNTFLSSIFKVNLIPNILIGIFFYLRFQYFTPSFIITYLSFFGWLNIGTALVKYYDQTILPRFFLKVKDLIPDESNLKNLIYKYDNRFKSYFWIPALPWCILLTITLFLTKDNMIRGGIFGFEDIWFWIFYAIFIWECIIAATGIWGVLIMIQALREVSNRELNIDPFHPDKVGGLSSIGNYAIATTVIFSTGALWLPLAFELAYGQDLLNFFVFTVVLTWMVFTFLAFVYPTVHIHNKAVIIQKKILDRLRKEYSSFKKKILINNFDDPGKISLYYYQLELLRNEYYDYQNVKLYPFEIKIITKLISSVLLPLLVWLVQSYLPTLIGL